MLWNPNEMWYIRLMTNVGKRIDAEIRRQHLSKVEVAKRADISVDGLRRITRGEVNPRRDTIERIASALQIDVVELLKGPESEAQMGRLTPGMNPAPRGVSNIIPRDAGKDESTLREALAIITLEKHILTEDEFEHCIEIIRKVLQER